jgi:UTP--glucose-1-phosphate uridylyltransferase
LAKTPVGAGGEIQLTDSIDALMAQETVEAFHMSGRAHDCGDKLGYLKAIVEYSMRDNNLGDDFTRFVKSL